jgi:hypothetical protein
MEASNITTTGATLTWSGTASSYEFSYRQGTGTWSTPETVSTTTKTLSGLTEGTAYTARVRALCTDQNSGYVEATFTTLTTPCDNPTALTLVPDTASIAVSWDGGTATAWEVEWSAGGTYDNSGVLSTPSYTITGLQDSTTYSVRVRAKCGDRYSDYAEGTTTTLKQGVVYYTITPSVNNSTMGSITPSGAQKVAEGASSPTFTWQVTDAIQYLVKEVKIDGVADEAALAAGEYTFANVTANHTIEIVFDITEGIGQYSSLYNSLKIYPNPARDYIVIAGLTRDLLQEVQILDLTGRIITNSPLSTGNDQQTTVSTIDISHLSTGMYLLRVQTAAGTVTKKFVKE